MSREGCGWRPETVQDHALYGRNAMTITMQKVQHVQPYKLF